MLTIRTDEMTKLMMIVIIYVERANNASLSARVEGRAGEAMGGGARGGRRGEGAC